MKNLLLFKKYILASRFKLALLCGVIVSSAFLEGIGIGLFYPLLEYVQKGESVLSDQKFKIIFDALLFVGIKPTVVSLVFCIFVMLVLILASKYAVTVLSAVTYNPIMKRIRDDGLDMSINYPLKYYQSISSGKFVSIFLAEVENVGQSLNFFILLITNAASVVVFGVAALIISVKLTILAGLIAVTRYFISGFFISRSRRLGEMNLNARARLNSYLIGIYQGVELVKSYSMEKREGKVFNKNTKELLDAVNQTEKNASASRFWEGLFGEAILCLLIYIAVAQLAIDGTMILLFLYIMVRAIPKIQNINDSRIRLAEYTASFGNLKEMFEAKNIEPLEWGDISADSFKESIKFDDVSFSYDGDKQALSNITIEVKKDETIALVGESGSGKTTITRLVLRLYDPTRGMITVDGKKLSNFKKEDWSRLVSIVSQDTFIFDDTLENNVKYGIDNCSDEQFWSAVKLARAEEFVNNLPDKEKTKLGERGVVLSGGQRQRVAIARAFLRNSPIMVFDEATSALDSITEKQIQDALEELSQNRTMLVVAHRLSTIRNADRIVVLDKGKIVEVGTHEELLDTGLLYKKYHDLQLY